MKILKFAILTLVALAALFVVAGLFLSSSAHVERSVTIEAPQATIFPLVSGYRNFNRWSPWFARDPDAKYTIEGSEFGTGAKMSWSSDHPEVGSGSQTITASTPDSRVDTLLDFGDQGTAQAFILLAPEGDATKVSWGFDTDFGWDIIGRYFGLMFDGWVGPDYETGLASLKELAEGLPDGDWSGLEIGFVEMDPITIAYAPGQASQDHAAIGQALGMAYGKVGAFVGQRGLEVNGQPVCISLEWNDAGYRFQAGLPVSGAPAQPVSDSSPVQMGQTPSGTMVKAVHIGPYGDLQKTYEKTTAYLQAYGFEPGGTPWEQYISDPGNTAEEELITHLYFPVK